jgi:hypothetical protein
MEELRAIAEDDVARCRALVARIHAAALKNGAYREQQNWTAPNGSPVHAAAADPSEIDAGFLANLRARASIFTGWSMVDGEQFPSGLAGVACRLAAATLPSHHLQRLFGLPRIGEPLRQLSSSAPPFRWLMPFYRSYLEGLPREYRCEPPLICGEELTDVDGFRVNRDVIAHQERMSILWRASLLERLREMSAPAILEIGAGYGALALYVKRVLPDARYIIVDLPRSLVLSGCYLSLAQRSHVDVYSGAQPARGAFTLVVAGDALPPLPPIDLAINTLSFSEMPESAVDRYADFIARHLAPGGALFEQNFDNTSIGLENFCDAERVLARRFPRMRPVDGRYLKGRPRIWTT